MAHRLLFLWGLTLVVCGTISLMLTICDALSRPYFLFSPWLSTVFPAFTMWIGALIMELYWGQGRCERCQG